MITTLIRTLEFRLLNLLFFILSNSSKENSSVYWKCFKENKYECRTATEDADVIIVNTALTEGKRLGKNAVIVGEDVDLACLISRLRK